MSDSMIVCPVCGEHFTHLADCAAHVEWVHPRGVEVGGHAMETPRVPAYQPILPPVPPQSLEVRTVSDSQQVPIGWQPPSPTGLALFPKWVPNVLALIATIAGVIVAKDMLPDHTLADQIAKWIVVLSGPAGIASQGVRK